MSGRYIYNDVNDITINYDVIQVYKASEMINENQTNDVFINQNSYIEADINNSINLLTKENLEKSMQSYYKLMPQCLHDNVYTYWIELNKYNKSNNSNNLTISFKLHDTVDYQEFKIILTGNEYQGLINQLKNDKLNFKDFEDKRTNVGVKITQNEIELFSREKFNRYITHNRKKIEKINKYEVRIINNELSINGKKITKSILNDISAITLGINNMKSFKWDEVFDYIILSSVDSTVYFNPIYVSDRKKIGLGYTYKGNPLVEINRDNRWVKISKHINIEDNILNLRVRLTGEDRLYGFYTYEI